MVVAGLNGGTGILNSIRAAFAKQRSCPKEMSFGAAAIELRATSSIPPNAGIRAGLLDLTPRFEAGLHLPHRPGDVAKQTVRIRTPPDGMQQTNLSPFSNRSGLKPQNIPGTRQAFDPLSDRRVDMVLLDSPPERVIFPGNFHRRSPAVGQDLMLAAEITGRHLISPNVHVILVHFPLGIFVFGLFLEVCSFLWRRSSVRIAAHWMVLFGGLLAVPAALSGIDASRTSSTTAARGSMTFNGWFCASTCSSPASGQALRPSL